MEETEKIAVEPLLAKYFACAEQTETLKYAGFVSKVQGLLIESRGPISVIGEVCKIAIPSVSSIPVSSMESSLEKKEKEVFAEVVGLNGATVQLMPYGDTQGIAVGARVTATGRRLEVPVSEKLLGRVVGPLGDPVDGGGPVDAEQRYPVIAPPPPAITREPITRQIVTGIRAIDGLLAVGRGQRLGVFAGSGVGKSTFQAMIARNTNAQVNVVALIGERGRELRDFIENDLGPEGMARTVIVVSTGDENPLARLRGAYTATAIAEYFRDQGNDVMFLFDSITRFARAMREIGLTTGEPPAQRGYPPSVFDSMQKLLERSGTASCGTITAFYTVLVDGDDLDEPVSDTVRGILDGHIVLSRVLAERAHYPAIDIPASKSRLSSTVAGKVTKKAAQAVLRLISAYNEIEDMINLGAYKIGTNPAVDEAIAKHEAIEAFLTQAVDEKSSLEETLRALGTIAEIEIPPEEMGPYVKI
ncbi:MAG: FliI/YscN family ATPase [Spirochaetaceae bacterium]|jgi:flagellum-specific ATP synthase|nr:FliI/YscN family ATPase [Spirochaetaceae bacterium]